MIKIAHITVEPSKLEEYKQILKEEIEASLRLEEGVEVLYAVWDREHTNRFTILENTRIRTLMTGISYRPTSKNILPRQKTWYFILKSWMQCLLLTDYG